MGNIHINREGGREGGERERGKEGGREGKIDGEREIVGVWIKGREGGRLYKTEASYYFYFFRSF